MRTPLSLVCGVGVMGRCLQVFSVFWYGVSLGFCVGFELGCLSWCGWC